MGFEYSGGLGISAGEILGTLMKVGDPRRGATKNAAKGMEKLAKAIDSGSKMEDSFAELHMFPRWLYILIANVNWNRLARKNGIKPKELYRNVFHEGALSCSSPLQTFVIDGTSRSVDEPC